MKTSKGLGLTGEPGVTLPELMVAVAIVGIAIMAGINAFSGIQTSIQYSKARTLAANLAQEKIQILKQQSYNRLMVSTSTAYRTDFTPNIPYDTGNYPPETILEGGISYQRLTYVQVAQEDSGNLTTLPATTPDTGMKLVTATVVWSQGTSPRKVQIRGVDSNPNTVMSISILSGTVQNATTLAAVPNVVVNVAENVGWRDTTSAAGSYTINLSSGNYTLVASADGYFTKMIPFSIAPNQALLLSFPLAPMSSGTVRGTAWINDHLVISQVVGSSETPVGSSFYQEYVEVFNPSTWTWTIGSGGVPTINLKYHKQGGSLTTIPISTYHTTTIAPGGYYLFANTGTVGAVGVARNVDAEYSGNYIEVHSLDAGNNAAAVGLAWASSGAWIDIVGWTKAGTDPPLKEGAAIVQATYGLENDEQFVRRTSTSGVTAGLGRAYDSGDNNTDFMQDGRQPMIYPPRNSSDTETIVAGVPAYGAVVSVADGLSAGTTASAVGSPPYAEFILPGVATGTWTAYVSSSSRLLQLDTVASNANATTWVPNATTSPSWPAFGSYSAVLSSEAVSGFISGRVTDVANAAISPAITVSAVGGDTKPAGAGGYYLLSVTPGNYTVTANPNNAHSSYVSQDQSVVVDLGEVASGVDFVLSQGGRITGYTTRDVTNALPGVAVAALNVSGITVDQAVSGSNGLYTLVNLTTGTYTIQPVLDAGEVAAPSSTTVTLATPGLTVSAGTFTITGAYGAVTGSVTQSGSPIKTGVLIVVTTTTISGIPPALSTSTLTGAPYYSNSSLEDGTYRVDVRGSTTTLYRAHGYYFTMNGQTPVINSTAVVNVSVTAGQTTSGVNFAW